MLHRVIAVFCAAATLAAGAQERTSTPDPKYALTGSALVAELRKGGYTLYFRHTATDFSQSDARMVAGDCSTQRNLTDNGRAQARAIGDAMKSLRLPIGQVIASPYCRTMDTARLIAGNARASDAVRGTRGSGGGPDYSALSAILASAPDPGTLRVVAGHGNPFHAIAGPPHLEEGEAAVLRAMEGSWVVVARVKSGAWDTLAKP
jgi:hypothetical protein